MKCKQCGHDLTANTLDCCPNCNPKVNGPAFKKTGKVLELATFLLVNTLVILGLIYLIHLLIMAWLAD